MTHEFVDEKLAVVILGEWSGCTGEIIAVEDRPHGAFYDNVADVLRRGGAMRITPQSVRETMRVLSLIRKGTMFSGRTNLRRTRPLHRGSADSTTH